MWTEAVDFAVGAAATVLLVSGLVKVAAPGPITATLVSLWNQAAGGLREAGWPIVGRALGVAEIGLAVWVVMVPSTFAGLALAVFAAGMATAGLMGALGASDLPCACFGGHDRKLGYPHVLQFPLWAAAAWCATVAPSSVGPGLDERTAMLAACVAAATGVHVVRMWAALAPLAQQRRRAAAAESSTLGPGSLPRFGAASW